MASAPGKVLLAGEYAVLDGAPAVVVAIDRRAIATLADAPPELSPFLEAAREEIATRFGNDSKEANAAARVVVDTRALSDGAHKLGLGSSAAATVAAVARAVGDDKSLVHELAHRAHAHAQEPRGSRGSGADIAASVWGGALVVRRAGSAETPLQVRPLPFPLELVLVWTGRPADTPTLVAAVRTLRTRDPAGHGAAMDDLAVAAARLAAALDALDPMAAVAAVGQGAVAIAALGARAGVALVPPELVAVAALAAAHRGAAKPTGAGGGDIIAAAFPDATSAGAFRAAARSAGMTLVTANVTKLGATLANPAESD